MASRFVATVILVLIAAAVSGFLVAAGWIPWTYPVIAFAFALAGWGFVARPKRVAAPLGYRRRHPEDARRDL
jgi:hypothetical protein